MSSKKEIFKEIFEFVQKTPPWKFFILVGILIILFRSIKSTPYFVIDESFKQFLFVLGILSIAIGIISVILNFISGRYSKNKGETPVSVNSSYDAGFKSTEWEHPLPKLYCDKCLKFFKHLEISDTFYWQIFFENKILEVGNVIPFESYVENNNLGSLYEPPARFFTVCTDFTLDGEVHWWKGQGGRTHLKAMLSHFDNNLESGRRVFIWDENLTDESMITLFTIMKAHFKYKSETKKNLEIVLVNKKDFISDVINQVPNNLKFWNKLNLRMICFYEFINPSQKREYLRIVLVYDELKGMILPYSQINAGTFHSIHRKFWYFSSCFLNGAALTTVSSALEKSKLLTVANEYADQYYKSLL